MYVNFDQTPEPARHKATERSGTMEPEPAAPDVTVIPEGDGGKVRIKVKTRNGL